MRASAGQLIAAVLVPPLAVFLRHGIGRDFWIACVLTIVGFLPGMAFALWMVLRGTGDGTPAAV
ncbi:YqaE/Pmp3 family membrane protein [Sphingomonas floccifaciens]|uniref:YqaE/Pmp3 family membrane protein n=1 Tax=Sphingomonas floccifaciens TaxID=1844115 RepID=A0ABW4NC96_9SPHN